MAVGTVSASNTDDIWQLIATNTPSSASTTSFTSISGYKKLMVTWQITSSTANLQIRLNNDTTSGNHAGTSFMYGTYADRNYGTYFPVSNYVDNPTGGYAILRDTDKTTPKFIDEIGGMAGAVARGIYFGSSAVTQLDLLPSSGTITGTVKLYGVAA